LKKIAIIVAGGQGNRIGGQIPKQFRQLNGKHLLLYSLEKFYNYDNGIEIIVAIPSKFIEYWESIVATHKIKIRHKVVNGGEERFHSVKNAIGSTDCANSLVAVHDAARPFVSLKLIDKLYKQAAEHGCAIPTLPVSSTLRYLEDDEWVLANRSKYRLIQTPQVFNGEMFRKAYYSDYDLSFTDDAAVYEAAGNIIHLIDGEEENIKITTPHDWEFAEFFAGKALK